MAQEIKRCFPGYKILYGLFSKSGFTERMKELARKETDILLIQETDLLL